MNKIKRTAKKYIKATKKRDLTSAINYLKQMGYEVIFFNTPIGNELIKAYGLEWETETKKAFTCYEEKAVKAVFVDESLHNSDKLYLLLHEIGHILLKHIGEEQDEHCDMVYAEVEADAFAFEVMNYKNNTGKITGAILAMIISFSLGYIAADNAYTEPTVKNSVVNTLSQTKQTPNTDIHSVSAENLEDIVYITATGTKYHLKDCRYVKNKTNITELSKEQAQRKHTPCSVCNP